MANMTSYKASRCGLEWPQGGTDFWQAFLGVEFEEGSSMGDAARGAKGGVLMWDAVNMFYYHWLIKKLLWPMAGQNIARQEIHAEIEEKRRWSQRDTTM